MPGKPDQKQRTDLCPRRLPRRPLLFRAAKVAALLALAASLGSCSRTVEIRPQPPTVPRVRVLLLDNVDSVDISIPGQYEILLVGPAGKPRRVASGSELRPTIVSCADSDVVVAGVVRSTETVAFIPARVPAEVARRRYRGSLYVSARLGRLRVINIVDLESYVQGVVPAEMYTTWPRAALEAQAVAARSYALVKAALRKGQDFDLYATVSDQKYDGFNAETAATSAAVAATAGQIILYRGQRFTPFYHSTCSGFTADARQVFGDPTACLRGAPCGYCENSKRARWTARASLRETAEKLGVPNLLGLSLEGVGLDGRVGQVAIHCGDGSKLAMAGTAFRERLGLLSTRFTVSADGPDFVFDGRGAGHGVGMCQWGARGMAEAGKTYKEILARYYPGALISEAYSPAPERGQLGNEIPGRTR